MSNTTLTKPTDELFSDLTAAQAEVVEGGVVPVIKVYQTGDAVNVYKDAGFIGWLGSGNIGFSSLSRANNAISSIIVSRGVWDFYDGVGSRTSSTKGTRLLALAPGLYTNVGSYANDRISSFWRRPGT